MSSPLQDLSGLFSFLRDFSPDRRIFVDFGRQRLQLRGIFRDFISNWPIFEGFLKNFPHFSGIFKDRNMNLSLEILEMILRAPFGALKGSFTTFLRIISSDPYFQTIRNGICDESKRIVQDLFHEILR